MNQDANEPNITEKRDSSRQWLFDLSAELRNIVYADLLIDTRHQIHLREELDAVPYRRRIKRDSRYTKQFSVHPQILCVCKQIHNEAKAMLYGSDSFPSYESHDAVKFLVQVRPSIQHVQHFRIEQSGDWEDMIPELDMKRRFRFVFDSLQSAKVLKSLTLPGDLEVLWSPDRLARLLIRMNRSRTGCLPGKHDAAALVALVRIKTMTESLRGSDDARKLWRHEAKEDRRFQRRMHKRVLQLKG